MRNPLFVACATIGILVCTAAAPSAMAVVNYADGGAHNESGATADRFTISNGSKVNFLGNGSATPPASLPDIDAINATGGSQISLSNNYKVTASATTGTAKGFSLRDSSFNGAGGTVNVVGMNSEAVVSYGAGNVTLNGPTLSARLADPVGGFYFGGTFAYGYAATDSTQTTINAANISAVGAQNTAPTSNTFASAVVGFGTSKTVINGGTFSAIGQDVAYAVVASQQAVIEVHGGNISFSAGTIGHHLSAFSSSTIKVYGSNFLVNGVPTPGGLLSGQSSFVQGILQDGTSFAYDVYKDSSSSTIELVSVPEPASLGLAAGAIGLMTLRRRRTPRVESRV